MRLSLLLLFGLLSLSAVAQETLTVAQVQRQRAFIEAKQQALLGKTDDAIAAFEELVDAEGGDDAIQFELGRLYRAKEQPNAAIEHVQKAYAARNNDIYAVFLATLYQEAGRHGEGAALYGKLRKADPTNEALYFEEAAFLVRAQDIKGAIGVYNELEERTGVNAELARLKHSLYLGSGDAKRAEKELVALVEAQPYLTEHRHLLAGFYTAQNDKKSAEKVYEEILRREPSDVRAQLALQNTASSASPGGESDDELMALLGRADVGIDLKIGKLLPLVQQIARSLVPGEVGRAVSLATELRRVHPDEPKATALLGDIYFQTDQLNEAADAYIATLALDDNVYPVWEQLLGTLYLANRSVDLRKYAEEALDLYPNRPAVYVHYAIGEAMRADFAEANALLDQAKLMVSSQAEATRSLDELSRAFLALAGTSSTDAINKNVLPGGPTGPVALLIDNGKNLSELKKYDSPSNTNALYLELLGDQLSAAGDSDAATRAYGRAKAAGSTSKELARKASKIGS
ncbi:tetratricopeptide repeat protein [Neolewinella antarctica]|uniref:Tetratricopeptide (TPR) repeat protein n=1 Tax=Neolewinella antarctica TaxID=442734 RepID=A0ABX0XDI4_9BACT|nr:tetratricopeptide repeat protein [Neolewinella antarctica]NJC27267.1 tetratricopeptide (TPR) repeat protein [Neolewinella antarctica]